MVDTKRTKAELLSLFPDNTARAIHPQGIRDLVVSSPQLLGDNVFEKHMGIGNDAEIDHGGQGITGPLVYNRLSEVLEVAEDWDHVITAGDGADFLSPIYAYGDYDRADAFPGSGDTVPSMSAVVGRATYSAEATGTPESSGPFFAGGAFSSHITSSRDAIPIEEFYGVIGTVTHESGSGGGFDSIGVNGQVVVLGSDPAAVPGELYGLVSNIFSQRSGAYDSFGLRIFNASPGAPENQYGIYISPHTKGTDKSFNIFSQGADSKNLFEGRSAFGPNGIVNEDDLYNPGDPGHAEVVLGIEDISTADGANTYVTEGLFVAHHYASTAVAPISVYGAHIAAIIDDDATTVLYDVQGVLVEAKHFGPSTVNSLLGIASDVHVQDGAGAVNNASAMYAVATNSEVATTLRAIWATLEGQSGSVTTNGRTIDILRPIGGSGFTNLTGLHIDDHSGIASGASWNIFSAGVSSKNKFEGRMMFGAPNSAPTDSDLGNGQLSFYLDQSANKVKIRAKYSDGTLKTGEVALA